MKRRLATRGGILLPALLALGMYAGCGGNAEVSIVKPDTTPDVAGVVELPSLESASQTGFFSRFAALLVARAEALVGVGPAADAPVDVTRYSQDDILSGAQIGSVLIGSTTTGSDGRYQVSLGNDIIDDCGGGRILVDTSLGGLTRAFAYSDEEDITVNAASEAMVRLIYNAVRDEGADLCTPTNDDLRQLFAAIDAATTDVGGASVPQINANAFAVASTDPDVINLLGEIFQITPETPTRTRTNTPTSTGTPTTVGSTSTPTSTVTVTRTPTVTAINTATDTPVNTSTPTNTPPIGTPTNTGTPTEVPTDTETPTPVDTAVSTPTETATAEETPTSTPPSDVPSIAIGSGSGAAGAQVTIGFALDKKGKTINIITPLQFTFDDTRLTFGTCTSTVAGKTVGPPNVVGNLIGVGVSGSEDVFPDGNFMDCTFTIKAEATGVAALTFVSAGMADQDFNDYSATGTSGEITVGGGVPTSTPTVAVPTNTVAVPTSTSTVAVPTNTVAVPTSTSTVAVPTSTSTVAAPTPTTPAGNNPSIAIGSTSGAAGAQVTVGFSLTKNGKTINIITPLQFTFDDTRVTFGTCTSTVAGKTVGPPNVVGNLVGVGDSGSEDVFPDGNFMNCTFTIKAEATGVAPVTFVSAGMADQDFNDYSASGTSGEITVGGGPAPTSTSTVAVPTSTSTVAVPTSTATVAVPTSTATVAVPTATATVAVPTSTATVAVPTATATVPVVSGPLITIGTASGAAGAEVAVPFSLTKNGPTINIITPLQFTFDDTRVTFGTCTSTVAGKTVGPPNVVGNLVGVGDSGSEDVFPDGVFMNCTFTIKVGATGVAPITFVTAGMADQDFNDYSAAGVSGSVTVN